MRLLTDGRIPGRPFEPKPKPATDFAAARSPDVTPLVSAVTIVRNGERFLAEALESALGQSYRDLELVVVDDGSTDRSAEIAERYVKSASGHVRIVRQPDGVSRGMSAARALGVRAAEGDLIGFLDADDLWLPEKITEQVAALEAHPEAGMVYGRTQMWQSWDPNATRSDDSFDLGVEPDHLYPPLRLLPQLVENRVQTPTTCNALIRRAAYDEVGGFEEAFPGLYEDQVFFAKLYVSSATYVSSRLWALYRRHDANETKRFSYVRYYRERLAFLEWLAKYLDNARVDGEVSWTLAAELERARHPYRAALEARLRPAPAGIQPSNHPSQKTVSVIVTFRDAESHLAQAIASVEAQDHERFELILVDDGSADSSTRMAQAAASRDPERIRYLDHPGHANLGKSSSRNAGLRAAHGDYVVFLDADDLLLPGKLSHQAAFLDSERAVDAVYGRTWYWEESGPGGHPRDRLSRLGVRWGETQEPPDLLVRYLDQPGSVPCLCAFMARREVLVRLGGFDESLQDLYEDQTLIAKLALHCRIRVDAAPGERYRQHENSSTRRAIRAGMYHPWRPNAARQGFLDWLERYSARLETPPSRGLAAAIARATRPYRHPRAYRVVAPAAHGWQLFRDRLFVLVRPEPRA
jgi:glycosyltransferase involved in cell wall biosynthesis